MCGWLICFEDLESLEVLELGGDCGQVLRRLRRRMARGTMWVNIKTLIVRGGEYAKSQAFKFESVKDSLGLAPDDGDLHPGPRSARGACTGP
jgi:hypothetical protein